MINVNSMSEEEINDYIFGDHNGPITNRFNWLERGLLADIQTIINIKQSARHLVVGGGNL
jgi:hypothetical protein